MWDVGFLTVLMHGTQICLGHGMVAYDIKKLSQSMKVVVLTELYQHTQNCRRWQLTLYLDQPEPTSDCQLLNLIDVDAHNATKTELMNTEVSISGIAVMIVGNNSMVYNIATY